MDAYTYASEMVKRWPDDQVLNVWEAIRHGGLGDTTEVNGVPVGEWIEIVYSEVSTIRSLI